MNDQHSRGNKKWLGRIKQMANTARIGIGTVRIAANSQHVAQLNGRTKRKLNRQAQRGTVAEVEGNRDRIESGV
jgi:hypothetical protein